MGVLSRIFRPSATKAAEGEPRDGPWYLPITGGWLPHEWGQYWNWWQLGYDPVSWQRLAIVEACVSAYAQTIAMCPGDHWRRASADEPYGIRNGHQRVTTSAASRVLRKPNAYQGASDFLLNLTRCLYYEGNAYALALRNERSEVQELHLMHSRSSGARVAVTGDVFYSLGGNDIVERQVAALGLDYDLLAAVPARDVLHVRLHTPRHPLKGESPLVAASLDLASAGALQAQALTFAGNQSRPSGTLQTEQMLTREQVDVLRDRWNEQSRGLNAGGTPILTSGLKFQPLSWNSAESQIIEQLKLTDQHIALVFRMPLQILGIGGTPFASTEALMQSWIATGLGFALNHIEEAFGSLFALRGWPDEYVAFDTEALLRSDFKSQIDGLAKSVTSGMHAPNEARNKLGLPSVEMGDEPRVQQQVVPLSAASKIRAAPGPGSASGPDDNDNDGESDEDDDEGEGDNQDAIARAAAQLLAAKRQFEIERRAV